MTEPLGLIVFPIAFSPRKYLFTKLCVTIATAGALMSSRSVKSRPRSSARRCFEEFGRDNIDLDGGLLAFRHWMFLNVGRERDLASTEWNPPGGAGGLDTGQLTDAF